MQSCFHTAVAIGMSVRRSPFGGSEPQWLVNGNRTGGGRVQRPRSSNQVSSSASDTSHEVSMDLGSVSLRFVHPRRDLTFLSDLLDLPPFRVWVVGAPRETPKGTPLSGTYKDSYWVSRLEFEPKDGFKNRLVEAVNLLSREQATVRELLATGGTVEIYVQLTGWINNGDSIDTPLLRMMAGLGATLSVEVFPD